MPPPTRRDALAALGAAALACRMRAVAPRAAPPALHELTATQALAAMRAGTLTSVAYATALLDRAAAHADLDAFITLDRAQVLAEARAADAAPPRGPLHGLPVAVKDVIDTAKIRTTYATAALRDHVPTADAALVATLRAAGAIVLGKTNCDELSFGSASQDSAFGGVHNPFDPSRIPGGSSGGSAAAVAARLAPVAIGADTTGSIRMPAALCGAIGFRPSTGRYPTTGVWPISPTLDAVGPIARSVDDVDLFDRVLAGGAPAPSAPPDLRGLRIGVPRKHFYDRVDDATLAATVERALATLRDAGVVLVEADLDDLSLLEPFACAYPILLMEARAAMRAFIASDRIEVTLEQVRDHLTADVRALFDQYVMVDPPPFDLAKSLADRDRLIDTYARYRASAGVALTVVPATPFTAPRIGQTTVRYGDADRNWFDVIESSTACGAAAGNPGLALPVGTGDGGLPVALLFEAAHGDDRTLIAAARAIAPLFETLDPDERRR